MWVGNSAWQTGELSLGYYCEAVEIVNRGMDRTQYCHDHASSLLRASTRRYWTKDMGRRRWLAIFHDPNVTPGDIFDFCCQACTRSRDWTKDFIKDGGLLALVKILERSQERDDDVGRAGDEADVDELSIKCIFYLEIIVADDLFCNLIRSQTAPRLFQCLFSRSVDEQREALRLLAVLGEACETREGRPCSLAFFLHEIMEF